MTHDGTFRFEQFGDAHRQACLGTATANISAKLLDGGAHFCQAGETRKRRLQRRKVGWPPLMEVRVCDGRPVLH